MTTTYDNIVPLRQRGAEPLPTAAYELCPGPCDEGETCFCALEMDLVNQGISKINEKWPTMTEEAAALLAGEALAAHAAIVAGAYDDAEAARSFARMLIEHAVSITFASINSEFPEIPEMEARFKAERDTLEVIESVLGARARDFRIAAVRAHPKK